MNPNTPTRQRWSLIHWVIFAAACILAALFLAAFWRSLHSDVRYLPMDEYNAAHTAVDPTEIAPAVTAQPDVYIYDRLSGRYVDEHPSGDADLDATQRKASEDARAMYADAAAYTTQHQQSIDLMLQTTGASVQTLCNNIGENWEIVAKARDAGIPMAVVREKVSGLYASSNASVSMRYTKVLAAEGIVTAFALYPEQPPAFFRARGIDHCQKLLPVVNHRAAMAELASRALH